MLQTHPQGLQVRDDKGTEETFEGTPLLVCFPSVGLASTIVGHYLIRTFNLPRIATIVSPELPPATVVIGSLPNPSVRVHGNKSLTVLVSEFPTPADLLFPMAEGILDWASQKKAGIIITVEGITGKQESAAPTARAEPVLGIPSTPQTRTEMQGAGIKLLEDGIVGGIAAAMLNEASAREMPLAVLFAMASKEDIPDHGAAGRLMESLNKLLPRLKLDPQPLYDQAKIIEQYLRDGIKLHKSTTTRPDATIRPEPSIYG
jgi:predicted ATP-grasp superfamily ATP-dependent carboligase